MNVLKISLTLTLFDTFWVQQKVVKSIFIFPFIFEERIRKIFIYDALNLSGEKLCEA